MANMTEREFLTKVLAIEGLSADLATYANEGIAKLDARNDKRKNTQTKAQKENEGVMNTIVETLTANGAMVASEIATAIGISTQKMHARGPMGLEELTTAKYIIHGKGQVR